VPHTHNDAPHNYLRLPLVPFGTGAYTLEENAYMRLSLFLFALPPHRTAKAPRRRLSPLAFGRPVARGEAQSREFQKRVVSPSCVGRSQAGSTVTTNVGPQTPCHLAASASASSYVENTIAHSRGPKDISGSSGATSHSALVGLSCGAALMMNPGLSVIGRPRTSGGRIGRYGRR
jgi:hypothetical protein